MAYNKNYGNFESMDELTPEEIASNSNAKLNGFKSACIKFTEGSLRPYAALASKLGTGTISNQVFDALQNAETFGDDHLGNRMFNAIHIIKEKSSLKMQKDFNQKDTGVVSEILDLLPNIIQRSEEDTNNRPLKRFFNGRIHASIKKGEKLAKDLEQKNKPLFDVLMVMANKFIETVDPQNPMGAYTELGNSIINNEYKKEIIDIFSKYEFACYVNSNNPAAQQEIYNISQKKDFVYSWHKSAIIKQLRKFILGKETTLFNAKDGSQLKIIVGFEEGADKIARNFMEYVTNNDAVYMTPNIVKLVFGYGSFEDSVLEDIGLNSGVKKQDVYTANNKEELKQYFAYCFANRRSSEGEKVGVIAQHILNTYYTLNNKDENALKTFISKNVFVVTSKNVGDAKIQEELDNILSSSFNKLPIITFNGEPCVVVKKYDNQVVLLKVKGEEVASLAGRYSTLMAPFASKVVASVFTSVLKNGISHYEQKMDYNQKGKPQVTFNEGNLLEKPMKLYFNIRNEGAVIFRSKVTMNLATRADGLGILVVPNRNPKTWGPKFSFFKFSLFPEELKVMALGLDCKTIIKGILKIVVDPTVTEPEIRVNEHIIKGQVNLDQSFNFYVLEVPKDVRMEEIIVSERGLLCFLTDKFMDYIIESGMLRFNNGSVQMHTGVVYGMTYHIYDGSADDVEGVYLNSATLDRLTMNGKYSKTKCGIYGQPFHGGLGFAKYIIDESIADNHIYVSPALAERIFRDYDGDIVYVLPLLSTDSINIDALSIEDLYKIFGMMNIKMWRERYDSMDDIVSEIKDIIKVQSELMAKANIEHNDSVVTDEESDFLDAVYND